MARPRRARSAAGASTAGQYHRAQQPADELGKERSSSPTPASLPTPVICHRPSPSFTKHEETGTKVPLIADQVDAPSSHAADPMAAATRPTTSGPRTAFPARHPGKRTQPTGCGRPAATRSKGAGDPALLQMIASAGKIVSPTGDIWEPGVMKDG